jgi:erythromycin esterase
MGPTRPAVRLTLGLLTLTLTLSLGLASCSFGLSATSRQTPSGGDPVVRWIQQNALPLRTVDPGGSDADLAALPQIVGDATIVGLGEETHDTHEFIDVKAQLTEYLISHLGFTTFVLENDWGRSQQIDAYINGGGGDLPSIIAKSLFDNWRTQEYQALFE